MHAAPPVSVRGTGGPVWRAAQALLPALGSGVFAVWALAHAELPLAPALPLALAAGWLGWRLARPAAATLTWDGQAWSVDGEAGTVQVAIDLDRWLLIRWRPQAQASRWAGRWLAMSAAEVGAQWPPLRAALYGRAPPADAGAGGVAADHV